MSSLAQQKQWVLSRFEKSKETYLTHFFITKSLMSKFGILSLDAQAVLVEMSFEDKTIRPSKNSEGFISYQVGSANQYELIEFYNEIKEDNRRHDEQR